MEKSGERKRDEGNGWDLQITEAALRAIESIKPLGQELPVSLRLSDLEISANTIPGMAEEAMSVGRPLENNLRPIALTDAIQIYQGFF